MPTYSNEQEATQQALEAAEQCIVDFIEVYKRGCSMQTLDLAVGSLKTDALPKIRAALRARTNDAPTLEERPFVRSPRRSAEKVRHLDAKTLGLPTGDA